MKIEKKNIFIVVAGLLALNFYILISLESFFIAGALAIATVIVIMKLAHNFLTDMVLLGGFIALISAYHFYFEPIFPSLPEFNGATLMFIGTFITTRVLVLSSKRIHIPLFSDLTKSIEKW